MFLRKLSIALILIGIPIVLGLWARYSPLPLWEKYREIWYVNGRPIFTGYDAYYFARLAEDYKLGIFNPGGEDKLRFVPDYTKYPPVIPFYSWLFAELSALTGKYVENLSFWLIPIFGVLFVIPLVLLFYGEGLYFTALGAALVGSLASIYVNRTAINRLDTDSIVLFSLFAIPMAVYYTYKNASPRGRYFFLLLLALFSNLFYWGYLHPDLNFVLWIFATAFFLLSQWNPSQGLKAFKNILRNKENLIQLGLLTLVFNPVILLFGFKSFGFRLSKYFFDFGKPLSGNFPNVQISITELQKFNLKLLSFSTIGSEFLFFIAFLGIILFILTRFRVFLLLFPTFLMGLLAFKSGARFAMFLAPILGLGIGYLLDLLWNFLREKYSLEGSKEFSAFSVLALLFSGVLAYSNKISFRSVAPPIMTSDIAAAFIELGKQTPKNAWIYTWWDYGYAIQYYARRATFHDGGSQFSPKTYFVALGFSSPNPSVGYNVTKSLEVCGAKCIEKLLKEGKTSEQIKEMFVKGELLKDKKTTHPVYWVFTRDLIGKFYWISYFGTWDFKERKGEHIPIISAFCQAKNLNLYLCQIGRSILYFNPINLYLFGGQNFRNPIKYFAIRTPERLKVIENPNAVFGGALEKVYTFIPDKYAWFYTSDKGFKTNFNQMYLLRHWEKKYFEKVKEKFPDYVFYLVR